MAIPKELNYRNEDDFTQRLLVPLLQRLGFSMTVNYHGSREFGRDLIFAEFDRFGHVRYHALQAKFIESISVNTVRDLIADAELSFINPFRHPQTGAQEHISTFYAVNGGSIAEGAVTTYFLALTPRYGSNVRLLAGKDVVALDRWASLNQSQSIAAVVSGMLFEARVNARVGVLLAKALADHINAPESAPFPMSRLRLLAFGNYLQQPLIPIALPTERVHDYWEIGRMINEVADSIGIPVSSAGFQKGRLEGLNHFMAAFLKISTEMEQRLADVLGVLGPLTAL